ncbi:MAG: hypothetical protein Q9157_006498 [Trypethelium eluteriae]
MIMNKKLDRFKQWAGEKVGGEKKTDTSDDFKALEAEMTLRHEGMEKLHKSMTVYTKSISKRSEGDDKEKSLPIGYLGTTMIHHGEDFEPESEFGSCLTTFGRAHERMSRVQETLVAQASTTWMESTERSLTQMKEYQTARKKLEQRRLAYDTSLTKMQKAKKEDFRVEEELRSQKAKYEESNEDVYRRMEDIKEAEVESVQDLTSFLEAELAYHDKCREILLQLKRDWPASTTTAMNSQRSGRSRSETAHSYADRFNPVEEEPPVPEPKARIGSIRQTSGSASSSPRRELPGFDFSGRAGNGRTSTFEGPLRVQNAREASPLGGARLARVPTEPITSRPQLRQVQPPPPASAFADNEDDLQGGISPARSASPAASYTSVSSRAASISNHDNPLSRKAPPPPPPPSRGKKPPPPPPMKRSALSTSECGGERTAENPGAEQCVATPSSRNTPATSARPIGHSTLTTPTIKEHVQIAPQRRNTRDRYLLPSQNAYPQPCQAVTLATTPLSFDRDLPNCLPPQHHAPGTTFHRRDLFTTPPNHSIPNLERSQSQRARPPAAEPPRGAPTTTHAIIKIRSPSGGMNGTTGPVQSAPAMPQQGAMPLGGQITREYIQQAFHQMRQQGVAETDPEYIKLRNLLAAVQQQQKYQQQKAIHQKQQQALAQQQRQQQSNQDAQPNGISQNVNGFKPTTQLTTDGQNMQNGQPQNNASAPHAQALPTSKVSGGSQMFSPEHLTTLRNQIAAFKTLSKNLPLPEMLQAQLFPSQQAKKAQASSDTLANASRTLDDASKALSGGAVQPVDGEQMEGTLDHHVFDSFRSPFAPIPEFVNYSDHRWRQRRDIVPSIFPVGVDIDRAREERENIVYNRIIARRAELEKLNASIGSWDTRKSITSEDNTDLKLKAIIEYKKLCLLPKQRALRQQIAREMVQSDNLAMTVNRSMYRRVKKQSLREARITEKLEKQQRDARESKEKKKHTDFLRAIVTHAHDVQKEANNQRQRIQKLGRVMLSTHQTIEKEEQKRVERTAKQRLQALKANDEETYLKLLGQAKDSRITHLLSQTNNFLKQLSASVKEQQRGLAERYGDRGAPEEESDEEEGEEDEEGGTSKKDYYEVAHRIKEEVPAQSTNLVGGSLKEYQLKGLQWMISLYNNNLNGILADEMGLGKTIQTISLVTYLIEKKQQPGPYLVIVPLSTLTNWNNEFEKWAPSVKRIVYKGPPTTRKAQQQQIRWGNFQVLLTTYEFIIKDRPILSKVKWLHMIVDEGHRMKNAESKLSSTITQYYTTRYRLILTGTPLQNNLPELWALLNFVLPTIFKSVKSFDEWFNTPFANTGGQDRMELSEEEQLLVIRRLHKVLRPFLLRRLKKDVEKDLPDKQERVIKCNFSALQAKLYKQLMTNQKLTVGDGKGGRTTMKGLSNMLMQLRKLCNHPFVFEEVEDQVNPNRVSNDLLWRTAGKFELLDRILPKFAATGHRVLMFFQMTQIMNIMEDFLRLRGFNYLRLDGSTKADDRSELLKQFNAPDSPYFCFLLSTRAGGLGLNLQTADTVVIYDSDWNPHQDLQAQDRAHRIGQKNEVRILRLITSNSVEEKILERAQFKLDMDGKVIQAGKFDNKSTNEERDAMLRVMMESAEAADNLEQDEMDDDDLNVIMMRSEEELTTFQQIDAERARTDRYGPGRKFPRLLGENELPDIYLHDEAPVVQEVEEIFGRGARERTRVKYDDGLTEEQWLDAVDNDDDTIEEAIARKQAAKDRRAVNKEKKQHGPGASTPADSRDSSESPAPQPRKRGRKPKDVNKRKVDDAALDSDALTAPAKKRGRQAKVVETLSPEDRITLQNILDSVHNSLNDLEETSTDPDLPNRGIIDPFLELPPKNDYPDYYMIIKNPICMAQITRKINRKEYQNLKQFRQDVGLLCNNCRTYNEDGSILYQDANLIENVVDWRWSINCANFQRWDAFGIWRNELYVSIASLDNEDVELTI